MRPVPSTPADPPFHDGAHQTIETRIRLRWRLWEPIVTTYLREHESHLNSVEFETKVELMRLRHRAHVLHCRRLGLNMRDIYRTQLDNPLQTEKERDARIAPYTPIRITASQIRKGM